MTDPLDLTFGRAFADALDPIRSRLGELEAEVAELKARDPRAEAKPGEMLSVDEACKRAGFSRATWQRHLADSRSGLEEVAVSRVGGRVLVKPHGFDLWLKNRKRKRRKRG